MWKKPEELIPLKAFLQRDTKAIEREVFLCPKEDELRRVMFALFVRQQYGDKWKWGEGAQYLYRQLVRGLGLYGLEDALMRLAKPKRGRREESDLALRIWRLKADGKTVPQMKAIFESEGQFFSEERIKSYLKTRRKKSNHLFW
jgi:hypothetical protein